VLQPIEMKDEVPADAAHRIRQPVKDGAIGQHLCLQPVLLAEPDGFDTASIF
jgi:hypothetical protein